MLVLLACALLAIASSGPARAEDTPAAAEPEPAEAGPVLSSSEAVARYAELHLRLERDVGPNGELRGLQVVDGRGERVDPWTLAILSEDPGLKEAIRREDRRAALRRGGLVSAGLVLAAASLVPLLAIDRTTNEMDGGYDVRDRRTNVGLAASVGLLGAGAGVTVYGLFGRPAGPPPPARLYIFGQAERDVDAANAALRRQLGLEALATPAPASTDPPTSPGG